MSATSVDDIQTPKGKVIEISSEDTPLQGFKKLVDNNILSAPVFDKATSKYVGFLDVRDLVEFVVFEYDQHHNATPHLKGAQADTTKASHDSTKRQTGSFLSDLLTVGTKMIGSKLTCTYLSKRNPFKPVKTGASLLEVVKILAQGIFRRVPVVNDKGQVVNIISQSSIITFLNSKADKFKTEGSKTIDDLHLGSRPVACARSDGRALDAFRVMSEKKLSGLAIVDKEGKFIANTSSSDLKLYLIKPHIALESSLIDFLRDLRQEEVKDDTDDKSPTIAVLPTSTLSNVIARLAATKVHKIFVADDKKDFKPLAVISLTDILRLVLGTKKHSAAASSTSSSSSGSLASRSTGSLTSSTAASTSTKA